MLTRRPKLVLCCRLLGATLAGLGMRCAAQAKPGELSAEEFLRAVRRPFQQEAWGQFGGKVVRMGPDGKTRADIRIAITFGAKVTEALVVLDGRNAYTIRQNHGSDSGGRAELKRPEHEQGVGLFDLGIEPGDMTLGFMYWNLIKELPREDFRRQPCRILALEHPDLKGYARVWFSATEGFPLRVNWYHAGDQEPWRQLEFKGAKRHRKDFWFVKEMRLDGKDWKTQVTLSEAELYSMDEKPVPEGLLNPPAVTQAQAVEPKPHSTQPETATTPAKRAFKMMDR